MGTTGNIISPQTSDILNQMYKGAQTIMSSKGGGMNTAPMKQTMQEQSQLASQLPNKAPDAPKLDTNLPTAPTPPDVNPFDAFKQFAPALLMFSSAFARGPSTNAIVTAASMMDAYKSGQKEKYEQLRDKWKDDTEQMIEKNKTVMDQYRADIDSSNGNIGLIQAKLTASASKFNDEHLLAMINSGNSDAAIKHIEMGMDALGKVVDAKTKIDKADALKGMSLSDSSIDVMADQILSGDKSALANLGRGAQGAANITAVRNRVAEKAKEQGLTGKDLAKIDAQFGELKSEATAQGRMTQGVMASANILDKSLPSLMSIAEKYQLSPSTDLNTVYNYINSHGSSEDKANFSTQLRAVTTDYAMLIGRGRITVHSDDEALKVLNDSMGISSLEGFEKATKQETKNIKEGLKKTDEEMFGGKDDKVIHWDDLK